MWPGAEFIFHIISPHEGGALLPPNMLAVFVIEFQTMKSSSGSFTFCFGALFYIPGLGFKSLHCGKRVWLGVTLPEPVSLLKNVGQKFRPNLAGCFYYNYSLFSFLHIISISNTQYLPIMTSAFASLYEESLRVSCYISA